MVSQKLIREILNLSQKQFAEKIDVDAITVARWETGKMDTNENNIEKIYTFALNNNIFDYYGVADQVF